MSDGAYIARHEDYGDNLYDMCEEEDTPMKIYTADFETTTDPNDCRVWAFACCNIDRTDDVFYGNSIEQFISWCFINRNCRVYFHNLAFDGAFIFDYIEKHGWEWRSGRISNEANTYTTLIGETNQIYQITLCFGKKHHLTIFDSLKVIPLSVKAMAKSYGLDEGKGDLDYEAYREPGHILTDEEKDYIRRDVQIVAKVLRIFLDEGLSKMTAGANALAWYKHSLGGSLAFRHIYPKIEADEDAFVRKAYRGGFTYTDPRYACEEIGEGIVLDVNSLYPSVMHDCMLPVGKGRWFDGEPKPDSRYNLWVACVTFRFKVKADHIPCLQIKGNSRFGQTEYIRESGVPVTVTITSVDWDLINQQYDVSCVRWLGGFLYQSSDLQFKDYVDHWNAEKVKAGEEGNAGKRQIAKLMLNSLYGKFATRLNIQGRRPQLFEDGVVRYVDMEPEEREPVYLPVGVFITANARYKTITSAQRCYDRFLYADTDSLHLVGTEYPDGLEIDPFKLGAWKHESTFTRAKFLHAKCYIEEIDGKLSTHVAGMPYNVHSQVTFDNFDLGAIYHGKLYQHRVDGGIVLIAGDMQIRG